MQLLRERGAHIEVGEHGIRAEGKVNADGVGEHEAKDHVLQSRARHLGALVLHPTHEPVA